jgi:WW domain-binding protein 2
MLAQISTNVVCRWSSKGNLYLSNMRMVFVASKTDTSGLQAFDLPLVYIRGDKFNQPIFGCNNLSGECWPVCEGGGPDGSLPPHAYKLFFLEGGVGTFLPLYFTFITSAREQERNRKNITAAASQPDFHLQMNQAFVDPNDPTSLFLTQPVSQTTAQAPVYAANYGANEVYQPLV